MAVSPRWRPTSEAADERRIRYGAVPGGRADRLAHHPPAASPPGQSHPGGDRRTLATGQPTGLAAQAPQLVSGSPPEPARRIDALLLPADRAADRQAPGKSLAVQPLDY